MLSHQTLSTWYLQLAGQLKAGVVLSQALRATASSSGRQKDVLAMAQACERGGSLDDALGVSTGWMPEADRLFLSAASKSARLPRVLRNLSERHAQLRRLILRLTLACAYPLAVLHLGLVLYPLGSMIDWETGFQWNARVYAQTFAVTAGPLWLLAIGVIVLLRLQSPLLARVAQILPGFRRFVRAQALSDFAFALGNFLEAGMRIDHAWQSAGVITRSPALRAAAAAMTTVIAQGQPPGPRLGEWRCLPPDFAAHYQHGESTGHLEQSLAHLTTAYQEQAKHALTIASLLYPGVLLMLVMALIGYHLLEFYGGYLEMLHHLGAS